MWYRLEGIVGVHGRSLSSGTVDEEASEGDGKRLEEGGAQRRGGRTKDESHHRDELSPEALTSLISRSAGVAGLSQVSPEPHCAKP